MKVNLNLKKRACTETFSIKQLSTGVFIEGFANKATVDRGDEIIAHDAWELDNFKRNPIILFNHGMDTLGGTPVGKATEVVPTEDGLYLKVKMSQSQSPGIKMVRELVEERILKAFSVGFNPKETDTIDMDGKSVRKISKAELFEVSIVGVPMNQDSLFEITEKSLTTKSLHELKGEILKNKGADVALAIEEQLGKSKSRKAAISRVAKLKGIEIEKLLDMLAGDVEIPADVAECFSIVVKAVDLKLTLEEALSALEAGKSEEEIVLALREKLKAEEENEEEETSAEGSEEGGEGEEEAGGKEEGAEGSGEASGEEEESSEGTEEDAKVKADFQDCVNDKVPKLVAEGMEQDQAVAVAIAKCQEEGKCQLTPASKQSVYANIFGALSESGYTPTTFAAGELVFVKEVSAEAQTEQPPSTPIKTEASQENFGSPHLEAVKQTNILLGALINEFQKINNNLTGLISQNALSSNNNTSSREEGSESGDANETENEKYVVAKLASLKARLTTLGY